jgi:hypothetical protein
MKTTKSARHKNDYKELDRLIRSMICSNKQLIIEQARAGKISS